MNGPVAETPSMLTDAQLETLKSAVREVGADRVTIRMVGNRPAFCQRFGSEEPVQFIVSGNPMLVRHQAKGWHEHFDSLERKGRSA